MLAAVLAAGLVLVAAPAWSQAARSGTPAALPRTAAGTPDLSGFWKAPAGADANLATGGFVTGWRIPYRPSALSTRRANFRNRRTEDPFNKCFMPGVPRVMALDYPFQIFETPAMVAIAFAWSNIHRAIYTNGTPHNEGLDFWMGDSRGHWEGDTLVVGVTNNNDRTWFDRSGNYHSDALTLVERFTMTGADTIRYTVTVEDPKIFTKPWTITLPLRRQKGMTRLAEHICLAEADESAGLFTREPGWYPDKGTTSTLTPAFADEGKTPPNSKVPAPAPNAPPIRRLADGTPDIQGYYSAKAVGSTFANFGLEPHGKAPYLLASDGFLIDPPSGRLPTQPWAEALRKERNRPEHGYDDPAAHCFPAGLPRGMYLNELHILQSPGYILIMYERMGYRVIALDGRPHLPANVRLWQGDSVGRWEGDTLVVDTTNLNGKTWLNEPGGISGAEVVTYAEHVIERITPVDGTLVRYEATVIDPLAYTAPWTMAFSMKRATGELLEVACKEDDQDLPHLKAIKDAAALAAGRQ